MNKIFKVVWNKSKNCYVVVSEFAKNNSGKKKIVVAGIFAALAMTNANVALAVNEVPTSTGGASVAFGDSATVTGANAVGLGNSASVTGVNAVALGTNVKAPNSDVVVILLQKQRLLVVGLLLVKMLIQKVYMVIHQVLL